MADEVPPHDDAPQEGPIRAVSTPLPAPPDVAPGYGFAVPPPRLSMARMREQHVALLKRMNAEGEDPSAGFLADVAGFQAGVQEAGAAMAGPDERTELQSTINFWQTVRIHAGERPRTMLVCAFDQAAARAAAGGQSPYKGLMAFGESDSGSFFGRYRTIIEIIALVKQHRLLAVTGLSGSGKSSVVRAGLIPELQAGGLSGEGLVDSGRWAYPDPIVPGGDPLAALVAAWGPIEKPEDLPRALDAGGVPVVLAIDQFEEVFTLLPDDAQHSPAIDASRQLFLDALAAAATGGSLRHQVIITMRSEFDSYVRVNEAFAALFDAGRYVISALRAGELRDTIELPAQRLGVGFEPGLASELVNSVLGEPAGLPLLQFTLNELWKRRPDGSPMRMQDYKDLGGNPRDILARRADEVFDGIRLDQDKVLSRRIFLELVTTGSGQEATSRRVNRSALDVVSVARDNVNAVLRTWRDAGLIRISPAGDIGPESDVEVAHEALVRNWARLVGWVEENFAAVRNRHAFRLRAERWEQFPEETLGELALAEARSYPKLDPLETRFVEASEKAVAKAKADRAALRRRWFIAAIFMALAESGIAGGLLWWAEKEEDPATWFIVTVVLTTAAAVLLIQFLVADIIADALSNVLPWLRGGSDRAPVRRQAIIRNTFRVASVLGMVFFGLIAAWRLGPDSDKPYAQDEVDSAFVYFGADGKPVIDKASWPEADAAQVSLATMLKSVGNADENCPVASTVFMIAPGIAVTVELDDDKTLTKLSDFDACSIDFSQSGREDFDRRFIVSQIKYGRDIPGASDAGATSRHIIFLRLAPAPNDAGTVPQLPPPLTLALANTSDVITERNLKGAVLGFAIGKTKTMWATAQAAVTSELPGDDLPVVRAQFSSRSDSDPSFDGAPLIDLTTGKVIGINIGSVNHRDSTGSWTNIMTIDQQFIDAARKIGVEVKVAASPPPG